MNKRKRILLLVDMFIILCLTLADQFTKYMVLHHLRGKSFQTVIPGVLDLTYLENKGSAFGMLNNQKFFIIFIALIFLGIIVYSLCKMRPEKKYDKMHVMLSILSAGALGNLIDRIRYDYVIDFIYVSLIHFPVFNVADIFITISCITIIGLLLFSYKEKDLDFLDFKQKKYRELK